MSPTEIYLKKKFMKCVLENYLLRFWLIIIIMDIAPRFCYIGLLILVEFSIFCADKCVIDGFPMWVSNCLMK